MTKDYYGLTTQSIQNPHLRLEFLVEAGPRIVRLFLGDSDVNLLGETPQSNRSTPFGEHRMYGGHRLWHAPEAFPRTYIPDNDGLQVEQLDEAGLGWRLEGAVETVTGIHKSIEIWLYEDRPTLALHHTLTNAGAWPVELAVWALTQMPLGGLAVFPQQVGSLDEHGLLPNRQIVLWPYTRLNDPRLILNDDLILIRGLAQTPPVKVGFLNRQGWAGYLHQGTFFCKRFEPQLDLPHVDYGCNFESFCEDQFLELETLSPLVRLEPGQSVAHREVWEITPQPDIPETVEGVRELVTRLRL